MGYNQTSQFPQGFATGDLTAAAEVFAAGTRRDIKWILLANKNAATQPVLLRKQTGPTTFCTVDVPPGGSVIVPSFEAVDGLEISSAGGADIRYTVCYIDYL